ncbi:MAG: hypothetical protein KF753_10970 [Caldilineaceae bacterium]|nr:hypothetical protein [Caldilineaceae bacterium]
MTTTPRQNRKAEKPCGWDRTCWLVALLLALSLLLWGCATPPSAPQTAASGEETSQPEPTQAAAPAKADVVSVQVTGSPGSYQFSVEIASPDTGCDQYADWWEVLSEQGELLYRRILTHSHVNEQPFARSGGPVAIEADRVVIVRAHLHPAGYGGKSWKGTVQSGFVENEATPDFAGGVETESPQPAGCDF